MDDLEKKKITDLLEMNGRILTKMQAEIDKDDSFGRRKHKESCLYKTMYECLVEDIRGIVK